VAVAAAAVVATVFWRSFAGALLEKAAVAARREEKA
jgi:hypothetical protein